MPITIRTSCTVLATLLGHAHPAWADQPDDALQRCLIDEAVKEDFNGLVSVSDHGRIVAWLARGRTAGPDSAPITAATRFNLASASKMFTAVAVAQLVDAGKLGLDEAVGRYVAGLTPEASAVTIRELLTHSAGLGNFFQPRNLETMLRARTASDLLPLIAADKPAFEPGSRFEYSNSGFALLGVLIEKVSGTRYGDYLQRHVFEPAGMKDTGLDPMPLDTLAVGMTAGPTALAPAGPGTPSNGTTMIAPDGKVVAPSTRLESAAQSITEPQLHVAPGAREGYGSSAGGLYSTADDLQRFAKALTHDRLVSPSMTAALTNKEIVVAPAIPGRAERDYGFGFGVGDAEGHRWFGHNGGTLGANSEFAVFPEDEWTLAVLSNRDPPSATRLYAALRQWLLKPATLKNCGESPRAAPNSGAQQPLATVSRVMEPPTFDRISGDEALLAMDVSAGIPSIQVTIDGQGPFTVGLDTGAPAGLHFGPDVATSLLGSSLGEVEVRVRGDRTIKLNVYKLQEVQIGAIAVSGWIADDGGRLQPHGKHLDAVLGVGSFDGYVVTLDYASARLSLLKGALPPAGVDDVLGFEGPVPTVPLTIGWQTFPAHLDTGNAGLAIAAPETLAKQISPDATWSARGAARTLGGEIPIFDSPLTERVSIGNTILDVARISYPSMLPVINIGSRALADAIVEFDVANHRVRISHSPRT